jgi:hypothetical protein
MPQDEHTVPTPGLTFGAAAEAYDAARPGYPAELLADVMAYAGPGGARAVEVGAGTGKATVPLAGYGGGLLCLEPDPRMAAVLRRATAHRPGVRIEVVAFEKWRPPDRGYGLLVAATAWHWLDPRLRWDAVHAALAPEGALALLWNPQGVLDPALHADLAAVDARHGITDSPHGTLASRYGAAPGDWGGEPGWPDAECRRDGRFCDLRARRVRRVRSLDTAGYVRFLSSVSQYRLLAADRRAWVLADTAAVLDAHGGGIRVDQVTDLFLARVKPLCGSGAVQVRPGRSP